MFPVEDGSSFSRLLGPGIVTASAGNDAGGVATYANAGANYGYGLIWAMVLLIPALADCAGDVRPDGCGDG